MKKIVNLSVTGAGQICTTNPVAFRYHTETLVRGGLSYMLVGYFADDRQSVDLQRDALIAAGVDERHIHCDKASGGVPDASGQ